MKPEIQTRLVNRLREMNPNLQCIGQLRDGDCRCVLGILCDLAAEDGIGKWGDNDNRFYSACGYSISKLTWNVMEWAGVDSYYPMINNRSLTSLNDVDKFTFAEIADFIEGK